MKPKPVPKKLLARPDGEIVWDSWMRKQEPELSRFQPNRDRVFTDWTSLPAIEAEFEKLFPLNYNIETRALSILQWHGGAALSTIEHLLRTHPRSDRIVNLCVRMLKAIHTDAAVDRLLQLLHTSDARDAVVDHARRWPLYMLQRLLALNPNRGQAAADLVLRLLQAHPDWLEPLRQTSDDDLQQTLDRLLRIEEVPEAPLKALPSLLRSPPWRNRATLPVVPELALTPMIEPARFHRDRFGVSGKRPESWAWQTNHIESSMAHAASSAPADAARWSDVQKALWLFGVRPEALDRAISCRPLDVSDFQPPANHSYGMLRFLQHLPPSVAAHVLQHVPTRFLGSHETYEVRALLDWLGDILNPDCVQRLLPRFSRYGWSIHHCLESDRLALDVAQASRNRWQRKDALQWLSLFPATAARGLIPTALGAAAPARETARHALREMAAAGCGQALTDAAERYGKAASAALSALLAVDAVNLLPDVMPSIPRALVISSLPRLFLRGSDRAIPLAQVPDVLTTLALSKADSTYAGLLEIQREVDADSLARFGQALLKWWNDSGAASKDRWMFVVQGLIGNDETARLLGTLLRQWRAGLNRVRAYDAMELLAQIGSDVALMQLHSLASQTRYADLRTRAEAMIKDVAEQRGLTIEQLADRTVPDLGLDADGKLELDFGARQFSVHFDESLLPYVRDAAGKRLKDLPKPKADDDAVTAKAATQRYKDLKKQAKSVVGLQVRRLEQAMCSGRRWTLDEFSSLLLPHPLLRHLVQRLVWGAYGAEGDLLQAFRVAEDLSLADGRDAACAVQSDASIGLAHPIELPEAQLRDMAQVFSDYEILQPFRQLDRETYLLPADAKEASELVEWRGRNVTIASLLGLEQRGWNRSVGDGGVIDSLIKPLGPELAMAIDFGGGDGWFVGAPADGSQVQEIFRVVLTSPHRWTRTSNANLAQLSRIQASEVQRDLHLMAWFDE